MTNMDCRSSQLATEQPWCRHLGGQHEPAREPYADQTRTALVDDEPVGDQSEVAFREASRVGLPRGATVSSLITVLMWQDRLAAGSAASATRVDGST
jgi:hypothetical protein